MKNKLDIIQIAKDLIFEQASSIRKLGDRLNDDFIKTVELILNCSGRLIVIGLGKSGIIGRKMVATLNSTGTLASFIHASDALHGDLGNINDKDIVLFISKSGNTRELKQLVPLLKNISTKIVAMTANSDSYLALNADLLLNTYVERETCPNNLAPTTSTTVQLVMADALAVSLLNLKNFSKEDFARIHPGGELGKKLTLRVEHLCDIDNRPQVDLEDTLDKVIMEISSKRLGATAVLSQENVVGIITDGDLRRMLEDKKYTHNILAKDLMTVSPKIIQKNDLLYNAFSLMKKYSITQLLVQENTRYIGIIHLHDILKNNIF
tara:strand:- start:13 stop:978 length:966 start_codon:yes stop_codon:yes gene_type:complete